MPRGRPPKPQSLKRLAGTLQPCRTRNEPKFDAMRPIKPGWLLPEAKIAWERLVPGLVKTGVLAGADYMGFAALCQSWARYSAAERKRTALEKADPPPSEADLRRMDLVINVRLQQVLALMSRFGLSASDRGRLDLPVVGENEETLEQYLERAAATGEFRDLPPLPEDGDE